MVGFKKKKKKKKKKSVRMKFHKQFKLLKRTLNCNLKNDFWEVQWHGGRVHTSGARGPEFDTYSCRVGIKPRTS